jgi:predicted metal-dependent hydrolase
MRHSLKGQIETKTALLGGREITYHLRRSARARNARLEIGADSRLTVVVPKNSSLREVDALLQQKRRWIQRTLSRMSKSASCPAKTALKEGDLVPYLGRKYTLVVDRMGIPLYTSSAVELNSTSIVVALPDGSDDHLGDVLANWLRQKAKSRIPQYVEASAEKHSLGYGQISVRDQRTRWGSCSHKGNLSFNWRLIMAPPGVVNYIVAHELAHLVEMNHSKRFWKTVEAWCPDYQRHKRWLKENEALLQLW